MFEDEPLDSGVDSYVLTPGRIRQGTHSQERGSPSTIRGELSRPQEQEQLCIFVYKGLPTRDQSRRMRT